MNEERRGPSFKLIAILVIVVLAAIILFQNTNEATIRLLFWRVDVPLVVLIALMLGTGFILGWLSGKFSGRNRD